MSIELPVATRHRRDMTEKLLKATINPNTHTHTSIKSLNSSWFVDVQQILWKYGFDELEQYLDNPMGKQKCQKLKLAVDRANDKYWTNEIGSLVSLYKNLSYLN